MVAKPPPRHRELDQQTRYLRGCQRTCDQIVHVESYVQVDLITNLSPAPGGNNHALSFGCFTSHSGCGWCPSRARLHRQWLCTTLQLYKGGLTSTWTWRVPRSFPRDNGQPGHTTGGSRRPSARRGGEAERSGSGLDADASVRTGNNRPACSLERRRQLFFERLSGSTGIHS